MNFTKQGNNFFYSERRMTRRQKQNGRLFISCNELNKFKDKFRRATAPKFVKEFYLRQPMKTILQFLGPKLLLTKIQLVCKHFYGDYVPKVFQACEYHIFS